MTPAAIVGIAAGLAVTALGIGGLVAFLSWWFFGDADAADARYFEEGGE